MTDLKRSVQDERGIEKHRPETAPARKRSSRSRTAGTDRDFDTAGASANPGHGHPREQRRAASGPGGQDRATGSENRTPKKVRGSRAGQGSRRPA